MKLVLLFSENTNLEVLKKVTFSYNKILDLTKILIHQKNSLHKMFSYLQAAHYGIVAILIAKFQSKLQTVTKLRKFQIKWKVWGKMQGILEP